MKERKIMTQETSELVATIEANLNPEGVNPTFDIANGTSAKSYKWFCEERNEWVFTIGYYTEGLGLVYVDEYENFEELIVGMEKLSSGNLSLWHISEEYPSTRQQPGAGCGHPVCLYNRD